MEPFASEQRVLFRVDIRPVTSDLKFQCPGTGLLVKAWFYMSNTICRGYTYL